jgi:hypothetical protein
MQPARGRQDVNDATAPDAPPLRRRILAGVLAIAAAVGAVIVLVLDGLVGATA